MSQLGMTSNEEPVQKPTTVSELIRQHKRLIFILAIGIVIMLLWNPVIHPMLDNFNYSDEGGFSGRPVYYSDGGRISRTLHRELEKCGFNDANIDGFLRSPGNLMQSYDANGNWIHTVSIIEITTGIYEIKVSCPNT